MSDGGLVQEAGIARSVGGKPELDFCLSRGQVTLEVRAPVLSMEDSGRARLFRFALALPL